MTELFLIVLVVFYFLPAGISYSRRQDSRSVILFVNLILGWTVFGWWLLLQAVLDLDD